jgi:hypothetical protein
VIDPAFPALSKAIDGSLLWRCATAAAEAIDNAWTSSLTARAIAPVREIWNRSLIAWTIAIGGALCLLLQPAIPAYVRPGLPWMWPLAAIAIAVVVATSRRALEGAWPHSSTARMFAQRRQDR